MPSDTTYKHVPDGEMMPHVGTLRASAVWGLPDVLATLGVEVNIVLNDARLPRDVFSSRDNVFTYQWKTAG